MTGAERQLLRIGFGRKRRELLCWRTVRLDPATLAACQADRPVDPACSRELLRWRDLLGRDPLPPSYRIARA